MTDEYQWVPCWVLERLDEMWTDDDDEAVIEAR